MRIPPRAAATAVLACAAVALAFAPPVRSDSPDPYRQTLFSSDPLWEGHANQPGGALKCSRRSFKFGWIAPSRTSPVGAVGGTLSRATAVRAYYAKILDAPKTLADPLSVSGTLRVEKAGGGGLLFGWFNSATSFDWRTPDFLGLRVDGKKLYIEYGTTNTFTDFAGPAMLNSKRDDVWTFDYLPEGGESGTGLLRLTIGKAIVELPVRPSHRADGATFDRFGLLNSQIDGPDLTARISSLSLDGQQVDLLTSPDWEGSNNQTSGIRDCVVHNQQSFGYSAETQFAGGEPGEIGGTAWRVERKKGYYADPITPVGFGDTLYAEGDLGLEAASSEADVFIGWFNGLEKRRGTDFQPNIVAMQLGGPSEWGTRLFPIYHSTGTVGGTYAPLIESFDRFEDAPLVSPKHRARHFWICYRPPATALGNGKLTVGLTDPQDLIADTHVSINVQQTAVSEGAVLDRFGIRDLEKGGHSVSFYLDNLRYTSAPGDSGPSERCPPGT